MNNRFIEEQFKTKESIHLNDVNGASHVTFGIAAKCLIEFDEPLIGCEMGIAYGGGVREIGHLWKNKGTIYGFDTFEGHPKHLGKTNSELETTCMDGWYNENNIGMSKLSIEYQQNILDKEKLTNVTLIKGLVTETSCVDNNIGKLHYAFLDMDLEVSTRAGFSAVDKLIVKGGYLCLHDVIPSNHLPRIHQFIYNEILPNRPDYQVIAEYPSAYLTVVKKIG